MPGLTCPYRGVLENIVTGPDLPKPKRRYWIEDKSGGSGSGVAAKTV